MSMISYRDMRPLMHLILRQYQWYLPSAIAFLMRATVLYQLAVVLLIELPFQIFLPYLCQQKHYLFSPLLKAEGLDPDFMSTSLTRERCISIDSLNVLLNQPFFYSSDVVTTSFLKC